MGVVYKFFEEEFELLLSSVEMPSMLEKVVTDSINELISALAYYKPCESTRRRCAFLERGQSDAT